MYQKGFGVSQDYHEAAKWCRLAAEQGDADAQGNLGLMYQKGFGVSQDYHEAAKLFRLAAEQGDADAQFDLGMAYAQGQGVTQDDSEAAKWFRLAAEQGKVGAQTALGFIYASGLGVPQDLSEAVKWLNLAAPNLDRKRRRLVLRVRDDIEKRMTSARTSHSEANRGDAVTSRPAVTHSAAVSAANRWACRLVLDALNRSSIRSRTFCQSARMISQFEALPFAARDEPLAVTISAASRAAFASWPDVSTFSPRSSS